MLCESTLIRRLARLSCSFSCLESTPTVCFTSFSPGLISLYENVMLKIHEQRPDIHVLGIGHMGGSKYSFLNAHAFEGQVCMTQLAMKLRIIIDELLIWAQRWKSTSQVTPTVPRLLWR